MRYDTAESPDFGSSVASIAPLAISSCFEANETDNGAMPTMSDNDVCVSDAAEELGVTPGRIRQLCIEYGIGRKIHPMLRLLSRADVRALEKKLAKNRGEDCKQKN